MNIDAALLEEAAAVIRRGGLVAFPTETVYGLGADTFNAAAVAKIFAAKGRPMDNPLISHIAKIEEIERFAREIPPAAEKLAHAFWGGPLTMILKKRSGIPDEVTAGLDTVAVRLPSHSVANALITLSQTPIAAPSANLSGSPSPTVAEDCIRDLDGRVDMIIDGGASMIGIESTVVDMTAEVPVVLRPGMISPEDMQAVIGEVHYGGEQKGAPKCPGMKYKHYSPKAEVYIIDGTIEQLSAYLQKHSDGKTAVLCGENDEIPNFCIRLPYGNTSEQQAEHLFASLREADALGCDTVYVMMPEQTGMGLAVYNRLLRAAAFRVMKLYEQGERS